MQKDILDNTMDTLPISIFRYLDLLAQILTKSQYREMTLFSDVTIVDIEWFFFSQSAFLQAYAFESLFALSFQVSYAQFWVYSYFIIMASQSGMTGLPDCVASITDSV